MEKKSSKVQVKSVVLKKGTVSEESCFSISGTEISTVYEKLVKSPGK